MKLVLIALNRALGRQVTMAEFRELLTAAHADLIEAFDEDRRSPHPKVAEDEPPAVVGRETRADTGQPLPGGQHLFETPTAREAGTPELGTCPKCGSAIIEAATATSPPVCLACGPLTTPPL